MISALFVFAALGQLAPIKPPPPKPVPVLVVDEKGKPVEGAEVFLVGLVRSSALEMGVAANAQSDALGLCALNPSAQPAKPHQDGWIPHSSVWAYRPGFALGRKMTLVAPLPSAGEPYEVILKPAAIARLKIVDPDDRPVVGARVSVRSLRPYHLVPDVVPKPLSERFQATSDSAGLATFRDFAPEEIGGVMVSHETYGLQGLTFSEGIHGVPVIHLRSVGRLSGRVVIDNLDLVQGQSVRGTTPPPRGEVPQTGGAFEASIKPDGKFDVPALAPGSLLILPALNLSLKPPYREEATPRALIEAGKETKVEIRIARGKGEPKLVRGSVIEHGTGRPFEGVFVGLASKVGLRGPYNASAHGVTNAEGRFECSIMPGIISAGVGRTDSLLPYVVLGSEPELELALRDDQDVLALPPIELVLAGQLSGVVRDERRRPVAGAVVEACLPRQPSTRGKTVRWTSVLTDSRGEFRMEGLPPDVEIRLSARLGAACTARAETTRATPEPKPHEFVISPANTYYATGRVVDEAGKPVKGATVEIWENASFPGDFLGSRPYSVEQGWQITTDEQGRYRSPSLLSRDQFFGVVVKAKGYQPASLSTQKAPDRLNLPFSDAVLKKPGGAKPDAIGSTGLTPPRESLSPQPGAGRLILARSVSEVFL